MVEYAAAWNRHDVPALLSMMTPDCVYEASAGPDVNGALHRGHAAVAHAFESFFEQYPDAQWNGARHFYGETCSVTTWTFTATGLDGQRTVTDGCDLLTISDEGLVSRKSSLRKIRAAYR